MVLESTTYPGTTDEDLCTVLEEGHGTPLAGIFIVWDEREAYYFLGGYNSEGDRGAGALAIWSAIHYTGSILALQRFDFLGSHLRQLQRFFRDFGGVWTPRYGVSWECNSFFGDLKRLLRQFTSLVMKSISAKTRNRLVAKSLRYGQIAK